MAGMTTVLTEFSNTGNSRTSTLSGHTIAKPQLVIEKRRVPVNNQAVAEYSCKIVYATEDADGLVMTQKDSIEVIARRPVLGLSTDFDALLVVARDIVAGDEFGNSVDTQEWL
jgi:hypothetical protein